MRCALELPKASRGEPARDEQLPAGSAASEPDAGIRGADLRPSTAPGLEPGQPGAEQHQVER